MTETQGMLLAYIEQKASEVIGRKEERGITPALADTNEILANIHEDTLECMRILYKKGRFKGVRTLNRPALMRFGSTRTDT